MSYENAPATRLLATRCCCCGRPLVDAESIERGVGPDCAEKYGFFADVPEGARVQANALVHRIAAEPKAETVPADVAAIQALGLHVLAAKLVDRLCKTDITVEEKDGRFVVKTPYSAALVEAMRSVTGRRWDRAAKVNTFPVSSKAQVFDLLKKFFGGKAATGPKGFFIIPSLEPVAPVEDYGNQMEREMVEAEMAAVAA